MPSSWGKKSNTPAERGFSLRFGGGGYKKGGGKGKGWGKGGGKGGKGRGKGGKGGGRVNQKSVEKGIRRDCEQGHVSAALVKLAQLNGSPLEDSTQQTLLMALVRSAMFIEATEIVSGKKSRDDRDDNPFHNLGTGGGVKLTPQTVTQLLEKMPQRGNPEEACAFAEAAVEATHFSEGEDRKNFFSRQSRFCVLEFVEEAMAAHERINRTPVDQLVRMGLCVSGVSCMAGKGKGEILCQGGQMGDRDRRGITGGDAVGILPTMPDGSHAPMDQMIEVQAVCTTCMNPETKTISLIRLM